MNHAEYPDGADVAPQDAHLASDAPRIATRRGMLRALGASLFGGLRSSPPYLDRSRPFFGVAASLAGSGCSSTNFGDEQFNLRLATFGKDVMWMPSSRAISLAMLEAARPEAKDVLYDLGSGDGIIPILAAQHFGVRAVGIEYNPDLVALSRRNALRAGVSERVQFRQGDIFVEDFSEAGVVTLYLGEELNQRLRPRLEALRPGSRIVSNRFTLGSWIPDAVIDKIPNEYAMLWIVPSQVGGVWRVASPGQALPERIEIVQSNQMLELRTRSGYFYSVAGRGRLQGQAIAFDLEEQGFTTFSASGTVQGDRMQVIARRIDRGTPGTIEQAFSLERIR